MGNILSAISLSVLTFLHFLGLRAAAVLVVPVSAASGTLGLDHVRVGWHFCGVEMIEERLSLGYVWGSGETY